MKVEIVVEDFVGIIDDGGFRGLKESVFLVGDLGTLLQGEVPLNQRRLHQRRHRPRARPLGVTPAGS